MAKMCLYGQQKNKSYCHGRKSGKNLQEMAAVSCIIYQKVLTKNNKIQ